MFYCSLLITKQPVLQDHFQAVVVFSRVRRRIVLAAGDMQIFMEWVIMMLRYNTKTLTVKEM